MDEFQLIQHFFAKFNTDDTVYLGIGDDAAIVRCSASKNLAVCVDTLIAGVHFPASTNPKDISYKAVAVNLSDLAAMGAVPKWITLALTLPMADQNWLEQFSFGLAEICKSYNISLIGGDTTRGPLSITVQALG